MTRPVPSATYRLQFNRDFTFADATSILGYLRRLGVSHVYASPFLKARPGSPHGYDIVDHDSLNPEIGDAASYAAYAKALHAHGLGQIIDIVPNHIGVGGDDSDWWLDLLEHGEASRFAGYFDIDWFPFNSALHHKVLLPFLGAHYGAVLEQGQLQLILDADRGAFAVHYHEHVFPLDPQTYPQILQRCIDKRLSHGNLTGLRTLIRDLAQLPRRTRLTRAQRERRWQRSRELKASLHELSQAQPAIAYAIQQVVEAFNGRVGDPASFDSLHRLLEAQAWRLAYWRVASDDINYRRFFDVSDLAGIRTQRSSVFRATHGLIARLIDGGSVQGLRVDHPDGLSDPYRYFCSLKTLLPTTDATSNESPWILAEKILARHERLPQDWPVAGATGYETAHLLNGLFVDPASEKHLTRLFKRYGGTTQAFGEMLYERKRLIIRNVLGSELTMLANLLSGIAQADHHTRDFTYQSLRDALGGVVAWFPVYRTYVTPERISEADRRHVRWAIGRAKSGSAAADVSIFDFIHDTLVLRVREDGPPGLRERMARFAERFQQYTAPVMAKGLEDTALYNYHRLTSLNDVGFDPRCFGVSVHAFHLENRQRLADWPHGMVSTSTHDSKRGEDVRARINVLSELPGEWQRHLARWTRLNRRKKHLVDDKAAPARSDEYLLYQTLVGTWPLGSPDSAALQLFYDRIRDYMLKAVRESKQRTSWLNPNRAYEDAVISFVRTLLDDSGHNAFLADFIPFQRRIARYGLLNSLSQTLLKLTVPGIPDIYQGNELWAFNLVDPDNRREVDYQGRTDALDAIVEQIESSIDRATFARSLIRHIEDGHAKLYLTKVALGLRSDHPLLFLEGDYTALAVRGDKADCLCAFARRHAGRQAIVVASRWFTRLDPEPPVMPFGEGIWKDTFIELPEDIAKPRFRDVLSGRVLDVGTDQDSRGLAAAHLFSALPMALLIDDPGSAHPC